MNSIQLAKNAEFAANKYFGILAPSILEAVKLAHIANWVSQQDDSIDPATVLMRAQEAIYSIHSGEYAVEPHV
jgi:hypothetical protein